MQITVRSDQTNVKFPQLTLSMRYARWIMGLALLVSDIFALLLAFSISTLLRFWLMGNIGSIHVFWRQTPILLILIIIFAWQGLYKTGEISQIRELKLVIEGISIAFLLISMVTFLSQSSQEYSRLIYLFTWILSILLVPVFRWGIRAIIIRKNLWGEPVAIIGSETVTQQYATTLQQDPKIGFKPILLISPGEPQSKSSSETVSLKCYTPAEIIQTIVNYKLQTVIVHTDIPKSWLQTFTSVVNEPIQKIIFVPEIELTHNINVKTYDLGGVLGLEMQHYLLNSAGQFIKRVLDLMIITVCTLISIPIILITSILIKLDSPGPILYAQTRIGKQGKPFKMWKFRTMVQDADQKLNQYLRDNPTYRQEWEVHQKLKDDPRVTRVGKWLRKLSLDELPQLVNVIKGEMSIVGPRPFMPDQTDEYGDVLDLYKCVAPGVTGLWQISGRNNTTYEKRVQLDGYYVRNWSLWLDFYILLKTVWVVLSGDGAY